MKYLLGYHHFSGTDPLAKIGRSHELLEVVAKYGDRAMSFVWEHKAALATTVGLTAFLANPEAFINGARDITQIVGENVVKPVVQAPGLVVVEVAKGTNWTVIFLAVGGFAMLCLGAKLGILQQLPAILRALQTRPSAGVPQKQAPH